MTSLRRIPPGRSGRLWLLGRLRAGRLAATLLDRKLNVLRTEQQRLRLQARQSQARWVELWHEADRWAARCALLGAQREARLWQPDRPADVTIVWTTAMGVRFPAEARCQLPLRERGDRSPGTAVLIGADRAFRAAAVAAVDDAAAQAALAIVDDEVTVTSRRLRAITDRWLPRMESALAAVNRDLDESEREQSFRLRWASGGASGRSSQR